MSSNVYQIPPRAKRILTALSYALVTEPPELIIKNRDEELIRRCESILKEFPFLLRIGFTLGVYVFDRVTFLFGFGFRRFVNLKANRQKEYAQKWLLSRVHLIRDIMAGLRGMLMICYFSHKDIWEYIEYDPVSHAKERIALREKLMKEKSQAV